MLLRRQTEAAHNSLCAPGMAANMSPPPLAERGEIHKSCKALEAVVNLLNDYCEAASAVVQLQKKLAKAIKEAAQVKCNSDAAGERDGLRAERRLI